MDKSFLVTLSTDEFQALTAEQLMKYYQEGRDANNEDLLAQGSNALNSHKWFNYVHLIMLLYRKVLMK